MPGRRSAKVAVLLAALLSSTSPVWAQDGRGVQPQTWLDWLLSLRIAGRPVLHSQAALALVWSLVAILFLTLASIISTRRLSLMPRGGQTALELVIMGLQRLARGVIGPRGDDFVPFIGSLFIYIAAMNLMGLIPGSMAPTSSFTIAAALGLVVFAVVQYYGLREHRLRYLRHFVAGVPMRFPYLLLVPLVFAIHLMGELVRPVTLALRLFGNIMAEETVMLILIGLVVGVARRYLIPIPVQLPNMLLGLLVAIVQAAVFTILTAVYLGGALEHSAEGP